MMRLGLGLGLGLGLVGGVMNSILARSSRIIVRSRGMVRSRVWFSSIDGSCIEIELAYSVCLIEHQQMARNYSRAGSFVHWILSEVGFLGDGRLSPSEAFNFLQWINQYMNNNKNNPSAPALYTHPHLCPMLKAAILDGAAGLGVTTLPPDSGILKALLETARFSDAFHLFLNARRDFDFLRRQMDISMFQAWVVDQCRPKSADQALEITREMEETGFGVSVTSDEIRIKLLFATRQYHKAFRHLARKDWKISTFIGNVILLHSLKSTHVYDAWRVHSTSPEKWTRASIVGNVIAAFSSGSELDCHAQDLEEDIQQCFPLDAFTYNLLLRRLVNAEQIVGLFSRMCKKG